MSKLERVLGLIALICIPLWGSETPEPAEDLTSKPETVYEEVQVRHRADDQAGIADSAAEGATGQADLARRPILRPGELLETAPGMIITQHSGSGKANQYFVRGFNLDHGTDFSVSLDHMQVNMPTHGHGQGYADLNFLIPELVERVRYRKGPYYADLGDFSSAGSAQIDYQDRLADSSLSLRAGNNGFGRLLWAQSTELAHDHNFLSAVEFGRHDGPWLRGDDAKKLNGVLRLSQGDAADGYSLTLMGYDNTWLATDQIPQRAVDTGLIDRYGLADPDLGGDSSRFSLSYSRHRADRDSRSEWFANVAAYDLTLFSNFTYLLENPEQGDEFEQADDRVIGGLGYKHSRQHTWLGRDMNTEAGISLRFDRIDNGLYGSQGRLRHQTIREDRVAQYAGGLYLRNQIRWNDRFRTIAGLRGDYVSADVTARWAANSDQVDDFILSPKFSAAFLVAPGTEIFVNSGYGFHSNDARGMTIRIDPVGGEEVGRVPPLSRSRGIDVGISSGRIKGLQTSLTGFWLKQDSELVFVGDGGGTEAGRPSRRTGIEWANHLTIASWAFDLDFTWSHARFIDEDPAGDYIPGSVSRTLAAGVVYQTERGLSGGLRLRHFSGLPLIEDNSVRGMATTLVNGSLHYDFGRRIEVGVEVFNLLDEDDRDIQYYYASRLAGEPAQGIEDVHYHPVEDRNVRLVFQWRY
ncbi:TonB-dependent receptor [Sulfidibacter corallicola]|uniref:TonB-dependent receptor n=1 Tax=Sulfidibacter corallicola TaxID=2818388 RepID=A0A8A4THX4_SULCO|nr:TonB-dependent receptor [Sulfidibacter corallicola]QTD49097.1 TonB-dependent receptor [Sulfidibacter corallicola]